MFRRRATAGRLRQRSYPCLSDRFVPSITLLVMSRFSHEPSPLHVPDEVLVDLNARGPSTQGTTTGSTVSAAVTSRTSSTIGSTAMTGAQPRRLSMPTSTTPSHDRWPVIEAPTGVTFVGYENPPGVTTENRCSTSSTATGRLGITTST
jgi:hypothetical protein